MRNNVSLHTVTRVAAFIILMFSVYLFFAGHHQPGGGFIGGLMTACGILLLYLSFDYSTVVNIVRLNYVNMIAIGLLIALGTGVVGIFAGYPYLKHFFNYFTLPIFGETELATAVLFDLGIYLVVVGITLLSILTIAGDR